MTELKKFKLENGATFKGLTGQAYQALWNRLEQELGLEPARTSEAAALSAAMVLRVALGLSASGASLCALVDDCRAGCTAVATSRVLANAGASCSVLAINSLSNISPAYETELKLADKCGVQLAEIQADELEATLEHIANCHALIMGLYSSPNIGLPLVEKILQGVNELQTPVHVIEAPPGIDAETGQRHANPTFAATTISLGLPLIGLAEGKEFCGRIYLCDIGLPISLYQEIVPELVGIFESQPVNQIFSS